METNNICDQPFVVESIVHSNRLNASVLFMFAANVTSLTSKSL